MRDVAVLIFALVASARLGLSWLNLRHLEREGHRVPTGLEREVDRAKLDKITDYTAERARFGLVHSVASSLLTFAFVFAGGLGAYDAWISSLTQSFVAGGVLFLAGLLLAGAVL